MASQNSPQVTKSSFLFKFLIHTFSTLTIELLFEVYIVILSIKMVHPHRGALKLENLSQIFTCFPVPFVPTSPEIILSLPTSSSFSFLQKSCLFWLLVSCLITHLSFELWTLSCRSESSNKSL